LSIETWQGKSAICDVVSHGSCDAGTLINNPNA
jgi:hypothetical protein